MAFKSDLARIIKQEFDEAGIIYDDSLDMCSLVARYFEMLHRRIVPVPRKVHFSDEIHHSLGKLRRETDLEQREQAGDAWGAVFLIRFLLVEGENVTRFLSKNVNSLICRDGLLWDFGMHHFHLNKEVEESGFVKRSDYLLFAIVAQENAYFVDVRLHPRPVDLGWVRQDLLKIVHSNWPELIEHKILRGMKGTILTNKEKYELRRKNCNHVAQLGDNAIAPIGGGTMADGSSLLCLGWALKLMHEIKQHQRYFDLQPAELRSRLEAMGIEIAGGMNFELVQLDSLNTSAEVVDSLTAQECLSRDLSQMGFTIVEATMGLPVVVSLEDWPCRP